MSIPCVRDLKTFIDDRGILTELCRIDWPEVETEIKQVYTVQNHTKGTVRAYHCHDRLWDYFLILKGSAKFITFDYDRFKEFVGSSISGTLEEKHCKKLFVKESDAYKEFVTSDKRMQMVVIPPRWMHGWMPLEEDTILVSVASQTYQPDKPDEVRISWDTLGKDVWTTKFK